MKRFAKATWEGTGKEGKGALTTQSGLLNTDQYSYLTRFEQGIGTNPEELIAAAHAGCFSMKLSFVLNAAGFTADLIETTCTISLEAGTITESHLAVRAKVPGMEQARFTECAEDAKANCPVSKLLNAGIRLDATLA